MAITIDGTNGFTTDNAALKLDGTTLVVDDTNNRVGIGAAPTRMLSVQGAGAEFSLYDTNGTADNRVLNAFIDNGKATFRMLNDAQSAGTTAIQFDTAGRVLKPNQPAFSATSPSLNVSGTIVFASALYNNGSHYSTSTGRFTAPVAGAYYFFTQHLANSGGFDVSFNKNGTRLSGSAESAETTYKNVANAQVVYMNANDYVYVEVWGGTSYGSTYCIFTGYLIG